MSVNRRLNYSKFSNSDRSCHASRCFSMPGFHRDQCTRTSAPKLFHTALADNASDLCKYPKYSKKLEEVAHLNCSCVQSLHSDHVVFHKAVIKEVLGRGTSSPYEKLAIIAIPHPE